GLGHEGYGLGQDPGVNQRRGESDNAGSAGGRVAGATADEAERREEAADCGHSHAVSAGAGTGAELAKSGGSSADGNPYRDYELVGVAVATRVTGAQPLRGFRPTGSVRRRGLRTGCPSSGPA